MDKKMMICPEAIYCYMKECIGKMPHELGRACLGHKNEKIMCPACVEYVEPCTDSRSLEDIEHCCPEPSMPLIEQELLTTIKGHITFQCVCGNGKCAACENTSRDIMHSIQAWLTLHDQQVRKDFADRVCEDMPLAPFINGLDPENPEAFDLLKKGISLRQNICNYIYRAMAEGGR